MNVTMWEQRTFDNLIFGCGKEVYATQKLSLSFESNTRLDMTTCIRQKLGEVSKERSVSIFSVKSKPSKQPTNQQDVGRKQSEAVSCLFSLLPDPEDGGNTFLRKIGEVLPHHTRSHPRNDCFQKGSRGLGLFAQ
jgi:hypothetical protein